MNLSRCEKGHFFDKEKFETCPHCAQGVQSDDSLTTIFTEEFDGGFDVTQPLDIQTTPTEMTTGAPSYQNQDVTEAVDIQNKVPTNPSSGKIFDNPIIEPKGRIFDDPIAEPKDKVIVKPLDDFDDDHTVAFYDDIFSTPSEKKKVSSNVSQSPAGRHAVSTPCTGWLIALDGCHVGQDFHLKAGKNFVGRDASMDIVLDGDKSVSRNKHAIVVYEPKQHLYIVQPGESSELVYLNNNVVLNPMQLKAYDIITVGDVNLLFIPLCGERFNWTDHFKKVFEK